MIYTSLMYHEIVSPKLHKYSVEPSRFEEQMRRLQKEVVSYVFENQENTTHPHTEGVRYCLLTFDDGHKSNLNAARLLSELGLHGYFYVVKNLSLENPEYLDEVEIKEISALGHSIGVHGKVHAPWARMEASRLLSDLRETKDWIEQLTGKPVITCSAPGGIINQATIDCIRSGIPELKYIRTSRYGVNHVGDTVIKSIGVRGDYSTEKVLNIATNDFWTMRKIMAYYHAKQIVKPLYHFVKR